MKYNYPKELNIKNVDNLDDLYELVLDDTDIETNTRNALTSSDDVFLYLADIYGQEAVTKVSWLVKTNNMDRVTKRESKS